MESTGLSQFVALLPAFQDNYLFVIVDQGAHSAMVVDPGDSAPILIYLEQNKLQLTKILITHHHKDHIGGIEALKAKFPSALVYASRYDVEQKRVPLVDIVVKEGDFILFGEGSREIKAQVLEIPAHTLGHVAYFFGPESEFQKPWLFCGDTLFGAGSGGLFEGTPDLLLAALKKIRALSDDTEVYCAHEYTEKNMCVALKLLEDNPIQLLHYQSILELRKNGLKSVPLSLGQEKKINPFLRWDQVTLQQALNTTNELETLTKVRKFRDQF